MENKKYNTSQMSISLQQNVQTQGNTELQKKQIREKQSKCNDMQQNLFNQQACLEIAGPKYIKDLIQSQSVIWRKKAQDYFPAHLKVTGYEFMTECYEILIKRLLLRDKTKNYIEEMSIIAIRMIEGINRMFLERENQIEREQGIRQVQYRFCWLTLANQLWSEIYSKQFNLCDSIIDGKVEKAQKLIQYFLLMRRDTTIESSPIFSEDSFNPQVYEKKMSEKYKWYRLEELLSDEQIEKMRGRILQIKNPEWKDKLLKDLDDNLVMDLSLSWNQ